MPDPRDHCLLVIDDSATIPTATAERLLTPGQRLVVVPSLAAARAELAAAELVLLAVTDPVAVFAGLQAIAPAVPVIPVTGADALATLPLLLGQIRASQRELQQLRADNRTLAHNLELLREDEEAGRRIQQRILPASPHDYGFCTVEHRVLPSLFLSGDFVDHFELAPGLIAFYLADVSGHGTSSAFVTLLLKTLGNRARRAMQRALADEGRARPSLLLAIANRELLTLGLGKHVTMICGVLDSGRREVTVSCAGHYPQPIVFDGKCASYLPLKGMPVGLFDEAVYEDRMHALPAGFALVLLSDGLMELMSETSLADKEARLLQVVGSGAVTVETLSREFALDHRQDLPDDIAMLVVRDTSGPAAG